MVAGDAGSNGGAQVQYLEELEGWVLDERKVVTFRWLALVLSVTANAAKKMLYDFCQKQGERKICPTYLVMGKSRADSGNGRMEVKVVSAEALEATKKTLQVVTAVHVYSVQPAPVSQPADISAQLWATDSEHSKEMLAGSTDAGVNLRTHRLSGVHCPDVEDVPLPAALKPPPDHAREVSPFARSGDAGKGAFPTNADKPKGKAIAPKDFFASATTGGGKGKGKANANAREEKGESKKPAPTGGIGSFFSKVPPSKKGKQGDENIDGTAPVETIVKSEIGTESKDKNARRASPTAGDKKDSVDKELQEDDKAGRSRVEGETKANGPSAKKKARLPKVVTEDDEVGSGSEGGLGRGVEGPAKAGKDGSEEEEEEWDDGNGKDDRADAGKKCISAKSNGGSSRKSKSSRKSTKSAERDEEDDGDKGGGRSNSADGTPSAPPAKKAKKGGASATKAGAGDDVESSTGRSRKGSKTKATTDSGGDEGGAVNGGKSKPRGKGKGGEGVKRKGRYDSEDECPEAEKVPVSGAMDKFTARGGANGGMPTKRTKVVLKTRTYMDGGYMKSVNEEVEVTDDEEEPLKPTHTNKTPSAPPEGDGKKVKGGGESKASGSDAPGSKGGGRTKKAGGLKSGGGKQSNMMSFFKKA